MALQFLFEPNTQFQNRNGVNNVGGFIRVYINGTDDRADTYCDFNGTLNEADIGLDTDGRAVVIVDNSKTYRRLHQLLLLQHPLRKHVQEEIRRLLPYCR